MGLCKILWNINYRNKTPNQWRIMTKNQRTNLKREGFVNLFQSCKNDILELFVVELTNLFCDSFRFALIDYTIIYVQYSHLHN